MKKVIIFLPFIFFACQENKDVISRPVADENINDSIKNKDLRLDNVKRKNKIAFDLFIDSIFLINDLVDIQKVNPSIKIDVKYASKDNFMGIQLYDSISKIYLNEEVANRLAKCQHYLDSIRLGFSLLVYDGVRPLQVQQEMWNALDSIPVYKRGKFISNPAKGSVHNYGAAVDLTILDSSGTILDMGAEYDDIRTIAYPSLEVQFLKSGELSTKHLENRKLLRKVMKKEGFSNIPTEWWHFNAYSRVTSSRKCQRILNESGGADWYKLAYPKKDSVLN